VKRAILIPLLFTLVPACRTSNPQVHESTADSQDAKEQFDLIRSLAGEWSGTGCEGTDRDPVEARFRVIAGGTAVEETLFPGTPQETIAVYRLDQGELVLTQSGGPDGIPSRMIAEPISVPIRVGYTFSGTYKTKDTCGEDAAVELSEPLLRQEVTRTPDPSMHFIEFVPPEAKSAPTSSDGPSSGASLWIMNKNDCSTVWNYAKGHRPTEIVRYHFTRKPTAVASGSH
jgi:hypothetical protein